MKEGERYVLASGGAEVALEPPANTAIEAVVTLHRKALVSGVTMAPAEGAETGGGSELYLAIADERGARALPAPPGRRAGDSREQAVPESDSQGGLSGVAWLEGASARFSLTTRAIGMSGVLADLTPESSFSSSLIRAAFASVLSVRSWAISASRPLFTAASSADVMLTFCTYLGAVVGTPAAPAAASVAFFLSFPS